MSCSAAAAASFGSAAAMMRVDEQREQRRRRGVQRVDLSERALERVTCERRPAAGEVQRRERARGRDARVEADEQLLGLFEAALANPQVGEPHERAAAQGPVPQAPEAHSIGQRGVGLRPASRRGEDRSVVRAAERGDRREPAALGDRLADADPLVGAADVVRVLAGAEELAEHLLRR